MVQPEQAQRQRPPDGVGAAIIEAIAGIGSIYLQKIVTGVVLCALLALVLPLSVVVFIVTSLVYVALAETLGTPSGPVAVVLGLGWLGGTLAVIARICVLAWRRSRFIRALVELYVGPDDDPLALRPVLPSFKRRSEAGDVALRNRVRAADSRLAPPDAPAGGDD